MPSFISLHTHSSPVGQMFLFPHYRGINLGSGSSAVLKARVQTQTDLPCSKPITLPLRDLEIPNYKPPPTSFHHLPPLIPPMHTHPLFSNYSENLLHPHGFLLPGLYTCCLLPLSFAWYSPSYPSGFRIHGSALNSLVSQAQVLKTLGALVI